MIIIATTRKEKDNCIAEFAKKNEIACFRGEEDDVLGRYFGAAKQFTIDVIVRITSDCPLMDARLVDELIDFYLKHSDVDYVANIVKRTYPRGFDIELFSFTSLQKAHAQARQQYQREHVTPYISENGECLNYAYKKDASRFRVTVDTREDFELIKKIIESFGEYKKFTYEEVITLLESRPDLVEINKNIEQKPVEKT